MGWWVVRMLEEVGGSLWEWMRCGGFGIRRGKENLRRNVMLSGLERFV